MNFYMPTKVYNEKDCVRRHSQELAALGNFCGSGSIYG